jgi:magnesium chelatase family protein
MNPCPCGFAGQAQPGQLCRCSQPQLARYRQKLSGPLLDRLDVHTPLPAVDVRALSQQGESESSEGVRARVIAARERQLARWRAGITSRRTNAELPLSELKRIAALGSDSRQLLEAAATQLGLSARAFVKVLRVARTIADLDGDESVRVPHVSQAIQGRILDRSATREVRALTLEN